MIQFLAGGNEYFVRRKERELRLDFSSRQPEAQILIFDFELAGEEEKNWALVREAWQTGLFAEKKMIVVRNVFGNELFSERFLKVLESRKELLADTAIVLLFSETGKLKKKNDFAAWLAKEGEGVAVNEKMLPQDVERYALQIFSEKNNAVRFSLPALRALLLECGDNMYRLENEIARLAFLKCEGAVSEDDVRNLVSFSPGGTVFEALDLIVSGRRDGAIQLFARELGKGDDAFRILGSCAWQLRILIQVRDMYDQGIRQSQMIAERTGMKEYSVRKCLSAITTLPMERLKKSLTFLAEADILMKTGGLRPDLAVYLFVAKF